MSIDVSGGSSTTKKRPRPPGMKIGGLKTPQTPNSGGFGQTPVPTYVDCLVAK